MLIPLLKKKKAMCKSNQMGFFGSSHKIYSTINGKLLSFRKQNKRQK